MLRYFDRSQLEMLAGPFVELPVLLCPVCRRASLELVPESFEKFESLESVKARDDEYWELTWVNGYFHGSLVCSRTLCGNKYAIAGLWKVDRYSNPDLDDLDDIGVDYLSVTYILPAFPLMDYPDRVPDQVREAIAGASQVLLSDASAAANRLRSAIEVLLDSQRIPKFQTRNLHARIEQLEKKKPDAAKHLMATKVIGNDGSHKRQIMPLSEVLDGMEHFARALELLYDRSDAALERRAAALINRKPRRSRVKKLSNRFRHRAREDRISQVRTSGHRQREPRALRLRGALRRTCLSKALAAR
jgi:uncharacterized protein YbaR (Trm112 family)